MMDDYQVNGEWHVVDTLVERREFIYECCNEIRFSKVAAVVRLRRKHVFYTMNIVLPCLMLSILTLVTFLSPPEQGEKISLGISVLLSFSVFMLTLSENMPKVSEFIPVFGVYTTVVMCMNTISVMLTVLVLNLHHRKSDTKVPRWMRKIVYGWLGRILCVHGPLNNQKDGRGLYHMVRNRTGTGTNQTSAFTYDDSNKPHQHAAIYMQQYAPKEAPSQNNCAKVGNADNKHMNDSKENNVPTPEEIRREKHIQACNDWKVLAQIVDRLFFWVSFLTLIGLGGATFIILWTS